MKRSVTAAIIATLSAAAFALTLGVPLANAGSGKSAKLGELKSSHGYGQHGNPHYRGHDDHRDGYRGNDRGHSGSHSSGRQHHYRPQSGNHHHPHRGYGSPSYGRPGYANHSGYYCSHCHYRTISYSIFYNHVFHHHHVPWYDIGALIVFDPVKLFFTFGGHGGTHGSPHH